MNAELRKFVVPEIVFGVDALRQIGQSARNLGATRPLVVTDPGLIRAGWVGKAARALKAEGINPVIFEGVTSNPKDHEVAAGVKAYQKSGCDVIIAVGGGSPMDCAKGIGIASVNNQDIREFEGVDEVRMPAPPLICVPTTGASADVSQFAIITDTTRRVKISIISKMVVPDMALIDPRTTTTMPPAVTAATGLDALVHAIESYVSNANSPITDINALAAVPLLVKNLIPAIENPENLEYRKNIMLGSMFAGMAFSNASLGLVHAMGHSLGGYLDLPHGLCNALLLEPVINFNYSTASERYDRIGSTMGLELDGMRPEHRKEALIKCLVNLREAAGIKTSIRAMGVTQNDLWRLSINAYNDACVATNPRQVSAQEIEKLYEQAFRI